MVGNARIDREAKLLMRQNPGMKLLAAREVVAARQSGAGDVDAPFRLAPEIELLLGSEKVPDYGVPTFLEVLGIDDVDSWDPRVVWEENEYVQNARFPIGYFWEYSEERSLVAVPTADIGYLGFAEMARGGFPHGGIQGPTATGKSHMMRGWFLALAALYSPTRVNFACMMFDSIQELSALPHMARPAAKVSNDPDVPAEFARYLQDEIDRRQRRLVEAEVVDIYGYRDKLKDAPDQFDPLPALIVFIDNWSPLQRQCGPLRKSALNVLRLGRSLGIHLIISDYALAEHEYNSDVWQHLMFRLTFGSDTAILAERMVGDPNTQFLPNHGAAVIQYKSLATERILGFDHCSPDGSIQREPYPESKTVRARLVDRIVEVTATEVPD